MMRLQRMTSLLIALSLFTSALRPRTGISAPFIVELPRLAARVAPELANPNHVAVVKRGAEGIRAWRRGHPRARLALGVADLRDARLGNADLGMTTYIEKLGILAKAWVLCAIAVAALLAYVALRVRHNLQLCGV